jgi:hypothetical protein
LWGALLRKLTVKHHEPKEDYDMIDDMNEPGVADAMNSLLKSSPRNELPEEDLNRNGSSTLAEGRRCPLPGWPGGYWPKETTSSTSTTTENSEPSSLPNDDSVWKTERRVEDGVELDYSHSLEKRHFPRPLSDVDELSETESCTDSPSPVPLHQHKRRVPIKVAGFVGWKRGSKRGESKLQRDHVES